MKSKAYLSLFIIAALLFNGHSQPLDTANFNKLRKTAFGLYGKDASEMLRIGLGMKRIASSNNYEVGLAASFNIIGLSRLSVSDHQSSLENFLEALKIYENLEDQKNIANMLSNIGVVYYYLDDHNSSLEYHKKAYEIRMTLSDSKSLAKSLNNLGIAYVNLGDYDDALNYYQAAKEIKSELKDTTGLSNTLNNIGRVYMLKEDYEPALDYFEQSLRMDSTLGNSFGVATSLLNIGDIQLKKKRFKQAKSTLRQAIGLAESQSALQIQMLAYEKLSQLYKQVGNYAEALYANEKFLSLNDSINDIEIKREIASLEARYDNDKILLENSMLSLTNEKNELAIDKQKNLILTLSAVGGLLLILLFNTLRLYQFKSRAAMIEKSRNEEIASKNALISTQNKDLKQLNVSKNNIIAVLAHDVKSPLNDVKAMIQLASEEDLSDDELKTYLNLVLKKSENVSNLIFNVLDWAQSQAQGFHMHVDEQKLHSIVKNQINFFESSAGEKDIRLINDVKSDVVVMSDSNVLNVICRNLISNAIKFTPKGGKIEIGCRKDDGNVWVYVKDSGVGMTEEEIDKILKSESFSKTGTNEEIGHGLGLMLVKEFTLKLGGSLDISSHPGEGSEFKFSIPTPS
ncbi:Signal transduction histidine kinase [Ekhidna lutea]|uniref:histidine kinase n=1 Tax=Ekhidna lutea TaxID=447679 RepID=A0A239GUR7_EKHLU|nr:tetratricopeptide repeat-containing sensor histidine kinase [Ekhidna lutea]SNS72253.1 Signal transduction histidine kinase [Ekhidna lutea]